MIEELSLVIGYESAMRIAGYSQYQIEIIKNGSTYESAT